MLSASNDICRGRKSDLSAPAEVYELSMEQSTIVWDQDTLDSSFGGLWTKTKIGEGVAEKEIRWSCLATGNVAAPTTSLRKTAKR